VNEKKKSNEVENRESANSENRLEPVVVRIKEMRLRAKTARKRPVTRFNHHHREFQKMDTRTEVRKVKDWREIEERAEIILRERMANDINGISSARRSGRL
tara:strand:- start:408 stop:710 length:303 start_codon:yes stop_codon:yes gene_type:complete